MSNKNSRKATDDAAIKDQVRQVLRGREIKLWLPPYVDDRGESVAKALEDLVGRLADDPLLGNPQTSPIVLQGLKDWQSHALKKLKAKKRSPASPKSVASRLQVSPENTAMTTTTTVDLELKILGLTRDAVVDFGEKECPFAKNIRFSTDKASVLHLEGVQISDTKDSQLLEFLREVLQTNNLRVIHRGKTLDGSSGGTLLGALLQATASNTVVPLLCMVSPDSKEGKGENQPVNTLQARIEAIRQAARQIRDSTKLEITDQHGATVPMSADDRLGFLCAMALHRMGVQAAVSHEDALVLLLEADKEWNDHPNLQPWKDRVDNYGLLQLDIAWVYLQLESLDNLPDSIQRLEEAERVLRKQVHVNFVTLALAQAEMGNYKEVPPLSALFAKLFLLQGIAYLCDSRQNPSSAAKSQERLDQAFALLQCLRMLAPADAVQQLLEVSQRESTMPSDAIAALRRSRGDLDAAAVALAEAETQRQQRQRDRHVQHKYGVCQNETDPVDLAMVEKLQSMLGSNNRDDTGTELAVGLLRLANNDLTRALEVYAECDHSPEGVWGKVEALDGQLVRRGLLDRGVWRNKKRKFNRMKGKPVDEMALVTLVSMGVDDAKARLALQNSANNVDQALLWLSTATETTPENGSSGVGSTQGASAPSGAAMEEEQSEDGKTEVKADERTAQSGDGNSAADDAADDAAAVAEGGATAEEPFFDENESRLEWAAQELLHQELGDILEERNLEKEVLGLALDEEWRLILKYRGQSE